MGIKGQIMGCTVLFTEDRPDVSIPALEYASFGSVPYNRNICTQEWVSLHPHGTTAEFKEYFDQLPAADKKVWVCY